jgi:hypothetical protein
LHRLAARKVLRYPAVWAAQPKQPFSLTTPRKKISLIQSTTYAMPYRPARNPAATLFGGGTYVQFIVQFISSAQSSQPGLYFMAKMELHLKKIDETNY